MENFVFSVPTKIYFGRGQIEHLGEAIREYGSRVLLVYGGGSIKKIGLYGRITEILKAASVSVTELSGVEPNPKIASVREGVRLCREQKLDVVLAVGGGSTIDCAKAIAAAVFYEGDAWEIVTHRDRIKKALSVVSVLTLAATGSEMNSFAVISNPETKEKLGTGSEAMLPKVSILDPEYTYSVSKKQTAAGTADIMSHIFENYFTKVPDAFIQARFAESLLKTCIRYGKIVIEEPDSYAARSNLMWASSLAINGLLSEGADVAWSAHPMEHELSAFYDITHGEGLAILTPNWMNYILNDQTVNQLAEYGVNVWEIDPSLEKYDTAKLAIQKTRDFFRSLGLPSTLKEVGIGEENLEIMAERAAGHNLQKAFFPLSAKDVLAIFKASL